MSFDIVDVSYLLWLVMLMVMEMMITDVDYSSRCCCSCYYFFCWWHQRLSSLDGPHGVTRSNSLSYLCSVVRSWRNMKKTPRTATAVCSRAVKEKSSLLCHDAGLMMEKKSCWVAVGVRCWWGGGGDGCCCCFLTLEKDCVAAVVALLFFCFCFVVVVVVVYAGFNVTVCFFICVAFFSFSPSFSYNLF